MDIHRYRLHLIGAALVLLSALLALFYLALGVPKSSLGKSLSAEFAPLPIPAESLFLPAEPRIIPETILSREPRSEWTAEDAREFWTDLGALDPGPLESAARKEVDRLYASVR